MVYGSLHINIKLSEMLTLPRFASRFVSLMLMCLSMLVSPLDMRTACQIVRAPRATPTVLIEKNTLHLICCQGDKKTTTMSQFCTTY